MSLTTDNAKSIYEDELKKGKSKKDAYNGTRTVVQQLMHEAEPSPYLLPPPKKLFIHTVKPSDVDLALAKALGGVPIVTSAGMTTTQYAAFQKEEAEELARRKAEVYLSVSTEHAKAFAWHSARTAGANRRRDAVHLVQQEHQSALWQKTDALVMQALPDVYNEINGGAA